MFLDKTYASKPYEVRLKAPLLWWASFILMLAAFGVAIAAVFTDFRQVSIAILSILGGLSLHFYGFVALSFLMGKVVFEGSANMGNLVIYPTVVFTVTLSLSIFLRQVFSKMIVDVHSQLEVVGNREQRLQEIARGVSTQLKETTGLQVVIEETAAGNLETERNINSITAQMEKLNLEYGNSEKSLQAMENKLGVLRSNSEDQSSNITETSAAVEEMVASISSVNHVIEASKSVVMALGTTATNGHEVLERIDSVREMTDFISIVAGQTNLLAMNAAIEAAHAGDAGKGFAVVADEVRKLAESSAQNAKQISTILEELLNAIKETGGNVNRTGLAFSEIQTGIRDVDTAMDEISASVHELSQGSGEILKATGSMNHLTVQVFDGIQELSRDTHSVQASVESVGDILENTLQGMKEISMGTGEIRNSMLSVQELAVQLARQAKTLEESGQG